MSKFVLNFIRIMNSYIYIFDRIDAYYEGSRDFQTLFFPIGFVNQEDVLKTAKEKILSRFLPCFNKVDTYSKPEVTWL